MEKATVYCLSDPRTKKPRYVGVTVKSPPQLRWGAWRAYGNRGRNDLAQWFRELSVENLEPEFSVLETSVVSRAGATERRWIRKLRSEGARLCNISDGGDVTSLSPSVRSVLRRQMSAETKAKISAAHKGIPSPLKGTKRPASEYESRRGRVQSDEERKSRRHPAWNKGTAAPMPLCVDCEHELKDRRSIRCKSCNNRLTARIRGKAANGIL